MKRGQDPGSETNRFVTTTPEPEALMDDDIQWNDLSETVTALTDAIRRRDRHALAGTLEHMLMGPARPLDFLPAKQLIRHTTRVLERSFNARTLDEEERRIGTCSSKLNALLGGGFRIGALSVIAAPEEKDCDVLVDGTLVKNGGFLLSARRSPSDVGLAFMAAASGISRQRLGLGEVERRSWACLAEAAGALENQAIAVLCSPLDAASCCAAVEEVAASSPAGIVIIEGVLGAEIEGGNVLGARTMTDPTTAARLGVIARRAHIAIVVAANTSSVEASSWLDDAASSVRLVRLPSPDAIRIDVSCRDNARGALVHKGSVTAHIVDRGQRIVVFEVSHD